MWKLKSFWNTLSKLENEHSSFNIISVKIRLCLLVPVSETYEYMTFVWEMSFDNFFNH